MANERAKSAVVKLSDELARKGWLPATSGNLSVKAGHDPLVLAVTRSGADKQVLRPEDVILVDAKRTVLETTSYRPSAETNVHINLYQTLDCECILHVHTMYNNLASEVFFEQGYVRLENHELLKALDHWEIGASIDVPIVENFHDLDELATAVQNAAKADVPGVLVRNHGIYAWGRTPEAAKRYLEAFEFLFQYTLLRQQFLLTSLQFKSQATLINS